jgi:organic radical activating enzyme
MPVRINSFMGKFGWFARKHFPTLASDAYLKLQFATRGKQQEAYIKYFMNAKETPHPNVINIETINRCNSTCEFCTANRNAEKRPFQKIDDQLFYNIIDQLADWGYKGHLTLYGNNEPLLDTRIIEFHKYAREKLPDAFIFMSTNGLILDVEKLDKVKPYINQLIINNYSLEMKLHDSIQKVYDHIKANPEEYKDLDVQIQIRYIKEVLTNRAGSAPNKQSNGKIIKETCLMPFTDMWIMPNGKLGVCCCDNFEVTDLADLNKVTVKEGWESAKYQGLRKAIASGRQNYPFCKYCDFIDAGFRMQVVKAILKDGEEAAHNVGGQQRMFKKETDRKTDK